MMDPKKLINQFLVSKECEKTNSMNEKLEEWEKLYNKKLKEKLIQAPSSNAQAPPTPTVKQT